MPVLRLDPDRLQPAFDALAARVGSDRAVEHGGISGTRLFIDPATDLAIVVLANRWDHAETSRVVIAAVHSALVPA